MAQVSMDDILRLSVAERLQLAENIWESISAHPESLPVTEAQKQEIDRRLEAHSKQPSEGRSWEEVRAKLTKPR